MKVKLKITRFKNWLQSLEHIFTIEVYSCRISGLIEGFRLFAVLCGYPHKNQRGLELKIILSIENDEEPIYKFSASVQKYKYYWILDHIRPHLKDIKKSMVLYMFKYDYILYDIRGM